VPQRPQIEGIVSRLFSAHNPKAALDQQKTLFADPAWHDALAHLGKSCGIGGEGTIRYRLGLYRAAAIVGKRVEAGPGIRQGLWHTFNRQDGLSSATIRAIFQDRDDNLWFGTNGGGVCRYDGALFTIFDTTNGLADNTVNCITEDHQGRLWFATRGKGVSCFDGQVFDHFTVEDGLAGDWVGTISVDDTGRLWFGSKGGVSCFDGQSFEIFAASATERRDPVSILWDSAGHLWFNAELRADYFDGRQVVRPDAKDEWPKVIRFLGQDRQDTIWLQGENSVFRLADMRQDQPFIPVNCGAIPEGLVESELFGHERGAFTSAVSRRLDKVELAGGGTLFLDEIGDMPMAAQVKLLRFLEEHSFERVGGEATRTADVRVVAATNRDLEQAMAAGRFRSDLFYRLSVFAVDLPPLRQRREDIVSLVKHFVQRFAHHLNRPMPHLSLVVMGHLQAYAWPGNVRELEHLVQRAVCVVQRRYD
jgi:sugar lactone lactonase YvrE